MLQIWSISSSQCSVSQSYLRMAVIVLFRVVKPALVGLLIDKPLAMVPLILNKTYDDTVNSSPFLLLETNSTHEGRNVQILRLPVVLLTMRMDLIKYAIHILAHLERRPVPTVQQKHDGDGCARLCGLGLGVDIDGDTGDDEGLALRLRGLLGKEHGCRDIAARLSYDRMSETLLVESRFM